MKKRLPLFFCLLSILFLFLACTNFIPLSSEIRIMPIGTNIIGISGEPSDMPYIEIIHSVVDEARPGYNKTASIMVSPPYIFQNDMVYMKYDYTELGSKRPTSYFKTLLRDFEEGGAEYLRIINHSPDKQVEIFVSGVPVISHNDRDTLIPAIRYRNAPVYFLLYPERKPANNVLLFNGLLIYFEGDRIGNLIVTEAWSINEIAALYRAEHSYSPEVQLIIYTSSQHRMMDMIDGNIDGRNIGRGAVFYDIIEPGEELRGNENIWLLALPWLFIERFEIGSL